MKRKSINVFSLSFIDCITCGLGAIILLFVIVNARSATQRNEVTKKLRGEVELLEKEVLEGKKNLIEARNTMEQNVQELVETQGLSHKLIKTMEENKIEIARYEHETSASKKNINRLKSDLKSMEKDSKLRKGGSTSRDDNGSKLRQFPGQGDRQYLTDLKMGGERIFILVDASASMLDDTILGIIRRRNFTDEQKLVADKWRHAVSSIDWLITQIPPNSKFQVYTFNETAGPLIEGSKGKWLDAGDVDKLNSVVNRLSRVVPQGGTSLANAFNEINKITPPPDNIFLLTDSLPTMGAGKAWGGKVSAKKRLSLFNDAVRVLPKGIPLNIILYPMEGDPAASSSFWRLAIATKGSFFCPARDWP